MDAASLSGRTLLHYRVLEKIGEGGMGAVYKARDTHLDRLVAVKILPPDAVSDPGRRQRFVQEAKAASSLNHPNILVVHDIASDQGVDFIVMEHIEGKTLAGLIGRKGLGFNEALGYAVQIAEGLARAHAAGIIHRDIKPSNIMVTPDGRVKILDFGLAKLISDVPAGDLASTATIGRLPRPKTAEGHILGTLAYMSPEQAEGKAVDARSDIFSFGSLLYELLTGQQAFRRDSPAATLSAILCEEPKSAVLLNESLPPEITPFLVRCLRKDPQRRWQTMSDLKVLLQDLKEDSESGKLRTVPAAAVRRRRSPWAWLGLGIPLAVAAALIGIFLPRKAAPAGYAITRLTFDEGITWDPTVSPDGKLIAYASDRGREGNPDIWVQQLAGGPPLQLTTDPSRDMSPCFSSDGSKIVFHSARDGGGIYEVATLGGGERRISDRGYSPRYSPDGSWISYIDTQAVLGTGPIKMFLLPAGGGTPAPFQPEFNLIGQAAGSAPIWSPDGKFILFNGQKGDDADTLDWWVAPVPGGTPVRTNAHRNLLLYPVWQVPYAWVESSVYFATGSTVEGVNLFRVGMDPKSREITGPAVPVTSGPGMQYQAAVLPDGRVFYANLSWVAKIWMLQGNPDLETIDPNPVPVSQDLTAKFSPGLSRDGSRLIFSAFGGAKKPRFEIRLMDLVKNKETVIPLQAIRFSQNPVISPDGSAFAYRDIRDGSLRTFLSIRDDAAGRDVCDACRIVGFFSDPRSALVQESDTRLIRLDLASGEKTALLESPDGRIVEPALSPDDRWVAFVLNKPDGGAALFVAPVAAPPELRDHWILLYDEDQYLGSPAWSPDGSRLYYLSERDGHCCIWSQKLESTSKKSVGETRAVFHGHQLQFRLNFPRGDGKISVARDKLAFWAGAGTGNLYLAAPVKK